MKGHTAIKGADPLSATVSCSVARRDQVSQFVLAGGEAVRQCMPGREKLGDNDDKDRIREYLDDLDEPDAERAAHCHRLTDETRSLVRRYRPAIEVVADALIDHRKLNAGRVRELVREAVNGS